MPRAWGAGLLLSVASVTGCGPAPEEPGADDAEPVAMAPQAEARKAAISCDHPVAADDSAETLLRRFGDDARLDTLYGPEGIEIPAVVLWPEDPARRVDVQFADEARREIASVSLTGDTEWRIAGLSVGDSLSRAVDANGRSFDLWGFSWDYGGYVSDLAGGRLATLPGGCRVMMRLAPDEALALPETLMGEMELRSDHPDLAGVGVRIVELGIGFPPAP